MAERTGIGTLRDALQRSSRSLVAFLGSDERAADVLLEGELPDRADYASLLGVVASSEGVVGLRLERRRRLLQIAALDVAGEVSLERAMQALADLADGSLEAMLKLIDAPPALGIIAMGKLGARELNYYSDIDIVFVSDGDVQSSTRAAEALLAQLGEVAPEGRAYAVDTNLRPEGRSGALVRSVEGYVEYYNRWAQPWEFQALIKARASAGNRAAAGTSVEATRELVFGPEITAERIAGIRRMKERVEEHAMKTARRARKTERADVKLGPGGIRDIEFSVQLLQLVHGGTDPSVRSPATLEALARLAEGGYVAEEDAGALSVAYRWLRNVEHRLQLWGERRVRVLPARSEELARLAGSLGFRDSPGASAQHRFMERHEAVLADVRGRFEKLFYRPLIESLADVGGTRLSPEALRDRLRVLGFRDVERAARTLEGVVSGTSRRAKLMRLLTPPFLRWLASAPLPDEGLFSFLTLGEKLGTRLDALGLLRDNPPGLELLARVLGSGRVMGDLLAHVPEELSVIADARGPGAPKSRSRLVREARASLEWREPERRLDGLRRFKRREMLRVALSDLAGTADVTTVGEGLADLADACLEAALDGADMPFAVVGMGKLGGRELNYSSDIDVMFVHAGEQLEAERVAEDLIKAIGELTPEGQAFRIDLGLRPEGKSGSLARKLDSYLEYYTRWSRPWEHQALIKARVAAGDPSLGARLIDETRRLAFPEEVPAAALVEIRHLKARMERERIPRGTDPRRHLKMGPGGMADVEFSVQILQLTHAHKDERLRTPSTSEALAAASAIDVLPERDARWLYEANEFLNRLRNHLFLMFGRPVDVLPVRPEDLEALGIAMGYMDQPRQEVEEEYLRVTRRARKIAERVIYG